MKKELLIIIGGSGSGKTTFAQQYAKEHGAAYISFDLIFNYRRPEEWQQCIHKLNDLLTLSQKQSFVLDGYILYYTLPPIAHLRTMLPDVEIKLCLCFASPEVIFRRRREKAAKIPTYQPRTPISKAHAKKVAETLFWGVLAIDPNTLLVDTTSGKPEIVPTQQLSQRWRELLLISELGDNDYDAYYQDIELPSGIKLAGYSESHKTWERLANLIDFRNKSVLDVGCFHGFFSFKAEEAGAKSVTGIEPCEPAIATARKIAWIRRSSGSSFYKTSLEDWQPDGVYDIALVLNMLHHVKNLPKALDNIFMASRNIIFELPVKDEEMILSSARAHGFSFIAKTNSHRAIREILVVENKATPVPVLATLPLAKKYQFNPLHYRWQSYFYALKQFPLLQPVVYLARLYIKKHLHT